ncbi:MAG: rhodanese-like domain-containing protein [Lautropia sp.]|uniref:Rhodanese-like domain-containing protein n=1 Tax=Lautropia dentalis TaxID=2490857 RepID=A0A3R8NAA4_9BURK|nr:rhodanese-like domain-containing protein [Lautropia dentalis]RKW46635.1 MAG: rhodanese-like domain-containing protein [Lautropia sp.]RRN44013.1 rhodanese-like domain-containing protein [Lautropia dentalis]
MNFISQNVFLILIAAAAGGLLLWDAIRGRGGNAIGTLEATQLINQKGAQVADLRADKAFRAGHLPASKNVLPDRVQTWVASVETGKPILLVCDNGLASQKAAAALKAAGRPDVYSLKGGIDAWVQAGIPLVK